MDTQQLRATEFNQSIICYANTIYRMTGIWESPNPFSPIIPLFVNDISVSIFFTRVVIFALKPFKQPNFVPEILSGILLGPSGFGRIRNFQKAFFPSYNFLVLEPVAHFTLVFYAVLMGLQADLHSLQRTGTKAISIAVAGTVIPFVMGSAVYFIFKNTSKMGFFLWGSALTVSGFSVLTRILEKHKAIHSETGKLALSSALVNEIGSWVFLALAFAVSNGGATTLWAVICTVAFVLFSVYCIRPALSWAFQQTPDRQEYSDYYICFVLCGAFLCGVITDACGTHPMIGAFVFGLVIPNEELGATMVERLEDMILGVMMPTFFAVCGLRTNVDVLTGDRNSWLVVALVLVLLCSAKIVSGVVVSYFCEMPVKEAIAIGILTNTKGLMVMIILESGQQEGALSTQTYSIMVVAVLVMTMLVTPATIIITKPLKNLVPYKRRTVQKSRADEELRILACIHGMRNVPGIINLLEASGSTQRSPINIFALQLVELVGRGTAALVIHNKRKAGPRNPSHGEAQTEQIIDSFDDYEMRCHNITVQIMTSRSTYATMDEDICNIANDKRATFIILPFHKRQSINEELDDTETAIKNVNESVMANAPCSVGILIDRGLAEAVNTSRRVAMLYFGGADDREGLAYAWRMVEHPDVTLKVIRFLPGKDVAQVPNSMETTNNISHVAISVGSDADREKMLDDDFLNKFKIATVNDKSISYSEMVLNDEEETIRAIKSLDEDYYDLCIVGKGRGVVSPLTTGLDDWCENPELGAIGDLLVTSEFAHSFSVLVVQQYVRPPGIREGSMRLSVSGHLGEEYKQPLVD